MMEVKEGLREWNENYSEGDHNSFSRPEIQAYTLIKTLPSYEPWTTFKMTYWRMLVLFMAKGAYQDDGVNMENVSKNLIRERDSRRGRKGGGIDQRSMGTWRNSYGTKSLVLE